MWLLIWWSNEKKWSVPMDEKQIRELMNKNKKNSGDTVTFEEGLIIEVKWPNGKVCKGEVKKTSSMYLSGLFLIRKTMCSFTIFCFNSYLKLVCINWEICYGKTNAAKTPLCSCLEIF